ncbi:hypothetical protein [Clostridium baratii]|uniref:hypothetical protein n=1 Tax=Clostridium baratii TaxID=1561 RepID=UPI00290328B1|nr:hypothetical protein [Clostridium baratii]MDU1053333.1 hypothetical protein [Clostridium baratii]
MYEVIADIRNKPTECLYGLESGGYYQIVSEEYENKVLIKASYDQVDNLFNELKTSSGEATYNELLDKIDKLKAQVEERDNLIEQYEEHNDARMERYFNSDCIL